MEDEPLSHAVARRLRGLLAEHRISGSALARELGMTQSAMSRRLTGETPLSLDEITAIADVLGITEEVLLGMHNRTRPRPDGPDGGERWNNSVTTARLLDQTAA